VKTFFEKEKIILTKTIIIIIITITIIKLKLSYFHVTLLFVYIFCSSMKKTLNIIMTSTIGTYPIKSSISNCPEPSIQKQETFGLETQTMHRPTNFVFKLNYFSLGEGDNNDQTLDHLDHERLWKVNDLSKQAFKPKIWYN